MQYKVKTKYQYFLLPISFALIVVIAMINFYAIRRKDLVIKLNFSIVILSFLLLILIPNILMEYFRLPFSVGSIAFMIYSKFVSILLGIFIIRIQEKIANPVIK